MKSSYMLEGFKSTVGPKDIPTCKQEGGDTDRNIQVYC